LRLIASGLGGGGDEAAVSVSPETTPVRRRERKSKRVRGGGEGRVKMTGTSGEDQRAREGRMGDVFLDASAAKKKEMEREEKRYRKDLGYRPRAEVRIKPRKETARMAE